MNANQRNTHTYIHIIYKDNYGRLNMIGHERANRALIGCESQSKSVKLTNQKALNIAPLTQSANQNVHTQRGVDTVYLLDRCVLLIVFVTDFGAI